MKHPSTMKLAFMAICLLCSSLSGICRITLECDFTSTEHRGNPMHYHWNVSNRISPMGRMSMPIGKTPLICVVRPLGGKSKNGEKLIDEDTYKWDGRKYVYDWNPLKKQIDTVLSRATLHQLLIDNPPWAFQRGIDFGGKPEVETYGNAWPPNDPQAWSLYIQDMLKELVKTYGQEQAEQWRYCIGREIGTAGHWLGSQLEFFEHYRNTERAIHAVLPTAKVGTHFLWASSKNSFGPGFVKWAKDNQVRYDFIGVSYYPFYDRINRVDLDHVYRVDFAPIKDIPEWNPEATLEIHEFALITSMSTRGNSYKNASKAHQDSFTVMLAKMMYEHDIRDVFRWGTGTNKIAEQTFLAMKDNLYFKSSKHGEATHTGNMIDAVFALDESSRQYNIVAYNYNADPKATNAEPVQIKTRLPLPPGTTVHFRSARYKDARLTWSEWKPVKTKAAGGTTGSVFELGLQLAPFSFQKIELSTPEGGPKPTQRTQRILTDPKTGTKAEVSLIEVRNGELICESDGIRIEIPVSALTDEDVAYLKSWMKTQ